MSHSHNTPISPLRGPCPARAHRRESFEDDRERTGEADKRGDEASADRLEQGGFGHRGGRLGEGG